MELSQEEIQANIQKLREKVGDPRTGGKGSQRRKVKVVSKSTVIYHLFREATIRFSRPSSRKLEHSPSALTKSTSSETITPSFTSRIPKVPN